MISFLFVALIFLQTTSFVVVASEQCDYFLAPSTVPGAGRGVFAGRRFDNSEVVEDAPSILIRNGPLEHWTLNNYVYGTSKEGHSLLAVGVASLFNHNSHAKKSVEHIDSVVTGKHAKYDPTKSRDVFAGTAYAVKSGIPPIKAGKEIFNQYGDDKDFTWFSDRSIQFSPSDVSDPNEQSMEFLKKFGQCVSDVFVKKSNIPSAGRGLFAKRSFKKGDIVYVSPATFIPKHEAIADGGILVNHLIIDSASDVAIMQLGLSTMINHLPRDKANVEIEWFDWADSSTVKGSIASMSSPNLDVMEGLDSGNHGSVNNNAASKARGDEFRSNVHDLLKSQFAPLDVAFRATRDIARFEELTMFYGDAWEASWSRHISTVVDILSSNTSNAVANNNQSNAGTTSTDSKLLLLNTIPEFRNPIAASETFFPATWRTLSCIGESCRKFDYDTCEYYLAPSTLQGAGRGIFAGRHFESGYLIEDSPSLIIEERISKLTSLHDYVYAAQKEGEVILTFGIAGILNHHSLQFKNGDHFETTNIISKDPTNAIDLYTHTAYYVSDDFEINPGEEIFTQYGEDSWFADRKLKYRSPPDFECTDEAATQALSATQRATYCDFTFKHSMEDLREKAICLSDVYVDKSTIPSAGRGLFARRDFKKGDIVYISPTLILPKHLALNDSGVLMNYLIAEDDSDITLIQLGLSGMINHQPKDRTNVAMEWFTWLELGITPEEAIESRSNVHSLMKSHFAPLDIAFKATRDIARFEELTMFYGSNWDQAWMHHMGDLLDDLANNQPTKPFRMPIQPSDNLFPISWYSVDCIGKGC